VEASEAWPEEAQSRRKSKGDWQRDSYGELAAEGARLSGGGVAQRLRTVEMMSKDMASASMGSSSSTRAAIHPAW